MCRTPKRKTPHKAPPRVGRRLFFGEDFETREDKIFPAFPSARIQIQTNNLVLKDIGYMDETQRSKLVAVGTPSTTSVWPDNRPIKTCTAVKSVTNRVQPWRALVCFRPR